MSESKSSQSDEAIATHRPRRAAKENKMDYYEYYGDSGAATVGQKRTSEQAEIGSKDQDDEKVASKRQKKSSSDHNRDSQ